MSMVLQILVICFLMMKVTPLPKLRSIIYDLPSLETNTVLSGEESDGYLRNDDVEDSTKASLRETPCDGYQYDGTKCKEINGRIQCGYNKNIENSNDFAKIDMGNGCVSHKGRIECGYTTKPFDINQRRPGFRSKLRSDTILPTIINTTPYSSTTETHETETQSPLNDESTTTRICTKCTKTESLESITKSSLSKREITDHNTVNLNTITVPTNKSLNITTNSNNDTSHIRINTDQEATKTAKVSFEKMLSEVTDDLKSSLISRLAEDILTKTVSSSIVSTNDPLSSTNTEVASTINTEVVSTTPTSTAEVVSTTTSSTTEALSTTPNSTTKVVPTTRISTTEALSTTTHTTSTTEVVSTTTHTTEVFSTTNPTIPLRTITNSTSNPPNTRRDANAAQSELDSPKQQIKTACVEIGDRIVCYDFKQNERKFGV